ncbi:MAG: class I SAM-dependent methyltransferase [Deltaproteobacteria bacterium]|nr:class I SAM-dependent methyltransferase [Candidatus Anaeroferrophillacea bacterium]
MTDDRFAARVKATVAGNFDCSPGPYQDFEGRYRFFADLTLGLVELMEVRPGSRVLDVGCGNGVSARVLCENHRCLVVGVDLSAGMIADGRRRLADLDVRLLVGDGEHLGEVVGDERFDCVMYNAALFVFPDPARALAAAAAVLDPGGAIGFSFYPELVGPDGDDLFVTGYERIGAPLPKKRVITTFEDAFRALADRCVEVRRGTWERPFDSALLADFFSIPAQSASLFPRLDIDARRDLARRLFTGLADFDGRGIIRCRLAAGRVAARGGAS